MALTPYKNQESQLNRSRSSSCSSPIRNRILYQEIYSMGANTLVRSYSCDQVFDKDEKGRPFQTTQIHVSSFITPEKENRVNCVIDDEKVLKKPRRLAVNFPPDKTEMAEKKTNVSPQPSATKTKTGITQTIMFILLTATNACVLYYFIKNRECSYVWDLEKTQSELSKNVFGQEQALSKINSILKACNSSSDMHIMAFTGSVGVGKTYASSIISHNFPWSSNKFITYSEYFASDVSKLLNKQPSPCGCNLIIIDDLKVKGTKEVISLISLLNSERKNNENFLIILIFQLRAEAEKSEIFKEFKNAYINVYHVPFEPLSEDVVRKCYYAAMETLGINIPEGKLSKLVEEKMKPIDILQGSSGCKGVTEDVASYFSRNLE